MKYLALATDYDGTIAHDGIVDSITLAALERFKTTGRKLILVTGRELDDLFRTFDHCNIFDRIVAENGAVLYHPETKELRQIAPVPPPELVQRLNAEGVPLSVGRSVVATVTPWEHNVLAAIRDLGVEWHVIFNKGSVMALPSGITKATGLAPALDELGISSDRVIGVGDAENDHAFLKFCGLGVAVANALPSVKETAAFTTLGARGAGVAELIERMVAGDLAG